MKSASDLKKLSPEMISKLVMIVEKTEVEAQANAAKKWTHMVQQLSFTVKNLPISVDDFVRFGPELIASVKHAHDIPKAFIDREKDLVLKSLIDVNNPFSK